MKELLRQLNLTQYEIKAYMALLNVSGVTAYKLGNLSNLPSGRIYDVVESLVSKGLVAVIPGTPRLVKAINPKIGLKALLVEKDRERKDQYNQLQTIINKLESGKTEEIVSLSHGEEVYYQNVADVYRKTKSELLVIAGPLRGHTRDANLLESIKNLVNKKVDQKMIIPLNKQNLAMAKRLINMGVKVRDYPLKTNLRIQIIDKKEARMSVIGKGKRAIIIINQEESVQSLREMYLSLWEKSKKIENP